MIGCPLALKSTSATVRNIMKVTATPAMVFRRLLMNRKIPVGVSIIPPRSKNGLFQLGTPAKYP
jgi:hypothetical protein